MIHAGRDSAFFFRCFSSGAMVHCLHGLNFWRRYLVHNNSISSTLFLCDLNMPVSSCAIQQSASIDPRVCPLIGQNFT
jgi:hypothetical protein